MGDEELGDIKMDKKDRGLFITLISFIGITLFISYLQYKAFNRFPDLAITIVNFIGLVFFVYLCFLIGKSNR